MQVSTHPQSGRAAQLIDNETVKALSVLTPYRSAIILTAEWVAILAAILFCEAFFSLPIYAVSALWIGARQHALLVLMHEAAHNRLCKHRELNEWWARVTVALPLFLSFKQYREAHLKHHRYLLTDEDPDFIAQQKEADYHFPKTKGQFLLLFLRDISGLGVYRMITSLLYFNNHASQNSELTTDKQTITQLVPWFELVFFCVLISGLSYFNLWFEYLLYWIIPSITWLKWVLYLRAVGEHYGLKPSAEGSLGLSRTTIVNNWISKLFISPHDVNYHAEHHLFPGVPYYNLSRLHKALKKNARYQNEVPVTRGYLNVLRECVN
ncbi:MAG: fatty acid desaturase family protein [Pseudomonadales bacterium]|nr:fatty acid desaturase family protein [Pseudomonadales bacterium]